MGRDISDVIKSIADGDETALAILYAEYGGQVYSLVCRILKNPALAQEVSQDTFIKVWQNPRAWDSSKGQFGSWLLTMARYTAIDRLRREIRRTGRDTELIEEIAAADDDDPTQILPNDRLYTLLHHLPDEQRTVIELAYFHGLKHSELAAALHLPLGTVKTRLRLGLQKLRSMLDDPS